MIVEMLHDQLIFDNDLLNFPVSPLQQVLVALNHYAGGQFQRTTALCGGISQPSVCRIVKRVSEAICMHKAEHINMPSLEEMHETAGHMMGRFGLPRIALGVDGMHARLEKAPRGIPPDVVQQDFFNRKGFYSFNVQVVCDDTHLIRDLDPDWPGLTHDARVWAASSVKVFAENYLGGFLIAGDSAYPISTVLMKPYSARQESIFEKYFASFPSCSCWAVCFGSACA
jgi:hypothetical protein